MLVSVLGSLLPGLVILFVVRVVKCLLGLHQSCRYLRSLQLYQIVVVEL